MQIPQTYTTAKFFQYAGNPTQNRRWLNGSCPICMEGKSWLKKKRLFYYPDDDYLYCYNCSRSWQPYWWVKELTGMSYHEIKHDVIDYTGETDMSWVLDNSNRPITNDTELELPPLPGECVNLSDELQLKFYKDHFTVKKAKEYCSNRRLFTAVNRPKTLYVCIKDKFHRNRLVIPYYNQQGRIESYITRTLMDYDEKPKYLLKFNSDKPLFNLHKIDMEYPFVFIFEGAIDAMFVKNGTATSGVDMTTNQDEILQREHPFHERIHVFDNFKKEGKEVQAKIIKKVKEGCRVFVYSGEFAPYKDLNDYCKAKNLDSVNPDLIVQSSYTGNKALLKLSEGH